MVGVLAALLTCAACEFPITRATERAWKARFGEALVEGHSDFKGLDVDSDTGFFVFSYRLPAGFDASNTTSTLREQIVRRNSCFRVVLETLAELQLRCGITTLRSEGFDEYRALVAMDDRRVTVMYGNFDSAAERAQYDSFVESFREFHHRAAPVPTAMQK